MSTFVLGCAQLGMDYGIANVSGQPSLDEALDIIHQAFQTQVCYFDTAQDYGNSEAILGYCFKELGVTDKVHVISKVNPKQNHLTKETIVPAIESSLHMLGLGKLHGLLFQGRWEDSFNDLLEALWKRELIEHAGISIYDEEHFAKALTLETLSFIQIPFNIFDQRALHNKWFERTKQKNKTVFIRSVYLQGLLLMDPAVLPANVHFAKSYLEEYQHFCQRFKLSPKELALAFVLRENGWNFTVMGAERSSQLIENIDLFKKYQSTPLSPEIVFQIKNPPEKLVNPSLW